MNKDLGTSTAPAPGPVDAVPDPVGAADVLVERDAEQAALAQLVGRLARGAQAPSAVVCGPLGIGRTALLGRVVSQARQAGVRVLAAQALPGRGLRATLSPVDRHSADLLGSLEPEPEPEPEPGPDPAAQTRLEHWYRALRDSAREQPLLVVVDDLQRVDAATAQMLAGMLRRSSEVPLSLVVAVTSLDGSLPAGCADVGDQMLAGPTPGLLLRLPPLSEAGVRALCQAAGVIVPAVEPGAGRGAWRGLVAAGAGNPRLLWAALRSWQAEGAPEDPVTGLAHHLATVRRDLVTELIGTLPDDAVSVLQAVVAARGLLPLRRLGELVGVAEPAAAQALGALRLCGLVDSADLRPLPGAEAVLTGLDPAARNDLVTAAARTACQDGSDDVQVAELLLTSEPSGQDWAAGVLRRAAAATAARGGDPVAVELLERARSELRAPRERAGLDLEIIRLLGRHHPEAADRRAARLFRSGAPDRARVAAADLLLARGDALTAHRLLAEAGGPDLVGRGSRAATSALYWLARHAIQTVPAGVADTEPVTWSAMAASPAPSVRAVRAWLTAATGTELALVQRLAASALASSGRDAPLMPQLTACRALLLTGDGVGALSAVDSLCAQARRRGAPVLVARALLLRSELWLRVGRTAAAARDLAAADAELPEPSWHPWAVPSVRALAVLVAVRSRRWAEAERAAFADLPPAAEHGSAWNCLLYARSLLLLRTARPQQALTEALECGRRLEACGWHNPRLLPWRSVAAAAWRFRGESERAETLLAEDRRLARLWQGAARGAVRPLDRESWTRPGGAW